MLSWKRLRWRIDKRTQNVGHQEWAGVDNPFCRTTSSAYIGCLKKNIPGHSQDVFFSRPCSHCWYHRPELSVGHLPNDRKKAIAEWLTNAFEAWLNTMTIRTGFGLFGELSCKNLSFLLPEELLILQLCHLKIIKSTHEHNFSLAAIAII